MCMGFFNADCPLNIAHRGASAVAPPNTLVAFERAIELGADAIEFDVRLSADGVPVVIHDATVDATTDGSGRVAEMTVAQLKRLDAGASFAPAFAGERIPTLEEVLGVVGERLLLNIELKGAGLLNRGLEMAVVDLIERCDLRERVLISSFNPLALSRVQRLAPHIPTGLLCRSDLPLLLLALTDLLSPESYRAFHPHHPLVSERHLLRARERGYRIHVWTVDDPMEMRRLINWGVDGIITNVPDVLNDLLRPSEVRVAKDDNARSSAMES